MSDSLAGTYAELAGTEIVNETRTYAYLVNGLGPTTVNVYDDCACPSILDLLNCPSVTGYVSPAEDGAPWYTEDTPASADFLGFIVDEFEGMGSPFTRNVKERVGNGGVLSRARLSTRALTWRGYLFGATCCAVEYGLRWLSKTLSRFDTPCRDCFGDDLELLVCCPESGESADAFRMLKGVALLEGPKILSQRRTCTSGCSTGCGGSCILEIEFTLVATEPYFYGSVVPIYDCVNLYEGASTPAIGSADDCGPFDCSDDFFDELEGICPIPALPPTATYTNSCVSTLGTPRANYYTVPRVSWNDLDDVVPVISITTGSLNLHRVFLGFYSSTNNNPCGDLVAWPSECDVLCDDLNIIVIPANSTFYIDGRTRKMALICPDGSVFPGERLTTGPWSWPVFNCHGFCMEVKFDGGLIGGHDNAQAAELSCVSLSLVPRSF